MNNDRDLGFGLGFLWLHLGFAAIVGMVAILFVAN